MSKDKRTFDREILHDSKFLVRYSLFNTPLQRPDMLEIFLTLLFLLVRVMTSPRSNALRPPRPLR